MRGITQFIKTGVLFTMLTAVLTIVGYTAAGFDGMILAFGISILLNLAAYFFGDSLVVASTGAYEAPQYEYSWLYADLSELAAQFRIKMPKLYIVEDYMPNAFATGRNQSKAIVAVTKGLLANLQRNEVKAVLAHELSHIKNRDMLIVTLASTIVGAISTLVDIMFWGSLFRGDARERNPIGYIVTLILAPFLGVIIQLAISRSREYAADELAATTTEYGPQLINALIKIEDMSKRVPSTSLSPGYSSLYIYNPFRNSVLYRLFSTHPPIEDRVQNLMKLI